MTLVVTQYPEMEVCNQASANWPNRILWTVAQPGGRGFP